MIWVPEKYRCAVLPLVSIRLEPVAAAKCCEKTPFPLIAELEVGFYWLLDLFRGSQSLPHPFDSRCHRIALSCGRGSLEKRGELAQLLAKFLFCGHGHGFLVEGRCHCCVSADRVWRRGRGLRLPHDSGGPPLP